MTDEDRGNILGLGQMVEQLAVLVRRRHYYCEEDSWYTCPAHPKIDSDERDECNCGAEEHNVKVDALWMQIADLLQRAATNE